MHEVEYKLIAQAYGVMQLFGQANTNQAQKDFAEQWLKMADQLLQADEPSPESKEVKGIHGTRYKVSHGSTIILERIEE